ncbi:MAG: endonuclease domain-containing protein [bacterium]
MYWNFERELIKRRSLRRHTTPEETLLWEILRNRKLGYKFRRQHSIDYYVVDFYCHEKMLVVELDGPYHEYTQAYDTAKSRHLAGYGITCLRFSNQELRAHPESVIQKIRHVLSTPHPNPLPKGEGARPLSQTF